MLLKELISYWDDLYTSKPLDKFLQGVKHRFDDDEIREEAIRQLHRYFQLEELRKKGIISNDDYIQKQSEISNAAYDTLKKITSFYLPILPIRAIAGTNAAPQYSVDYKEIEEWKLIPKGDIKSKIGIRVEGDSMNPLYLDGDTLVCKRVVVDEVTERQTVVVVAKDDTIFLKKIKKKGSSLELISINPDFPSFDLPLREIAEIWLVDGKLKA